MYMYISAYVARIVQLSIFVAEIMHIGKVLTSSTSSRIDQSTSIPTSLYEFPNGYNINLTVERFKLCEGLFDASSSNLKVRMFNLS